MLGTIAIRNWLHCFLSYVFWVGWKRMRKVVGDVDFFVIVPRRTYSMEM